MAAGEPRDRAVASMFRSSRLVLGGHERQVGHVAQIGQVEGSVVGGAVLARRPARSRQKVTGRFWADVVDDLVVGALQEGRIDGHHRQVAVRGQAGGEGHGVLLADAHVHEPVGEGFGEAGQPAPSGMAAVMAMILSFSRARSVRVWPKTSV